MATTLQSPGVSVSVIDESFYTPAAAGTVPMIFVATAQDKMNASASGTAQGTTLAKDGTVWVITSQRDLTDTFGTPYFETDAEGNPVNGGELNEYGLQAAYSALGVSSRAYIVRANVDLGQLKPTATEPTGTPVNGTEWLDTMDSTFGVNEWNATTKTFTVKTPLVIDASNLTTDYDSMNSSPSSAFGTVGSYCMVFLGGIGQLFYKNSSGTWVSVVDGFDSGKKVRLSPNYQYPDFTPSGLSAINGSIWIKTTSPSQGSNWVFKVYSATSNQWNLVSAPLYYTRDVAIAALDSTGGGQNIPVGSLFVQYDVTQTNNVVYQPLIRYRNSPTSISVTSSSVLNSNAAFTISETLANGAYGSTYTINTYASSSVPLGQLIATAINSTAGLQFTSATWDSALNRLTISHKLGGEIKFVESQGNPLTVTLDMSPSTVANFYAGPGSTYLASNWKPLNYEALPTTPTVNPNDGQLWYDSSLDVDIMYNNGTQWVGYLNAFSSTDPAGPTVSASQPTTQQDGSDLVTGDIWVSTADPENYGSEIYVYDGTNWILQNVQDHDSPNGWVFHDARWANTGTSEVSTSIADLLASNYVDPDCVDPALYPRGTRLWNTRRSGNNVKKYMTNYIDLNSTNPRVGNEAMTDYAPNRWVTASPNDANGVGQFGRHAQRAVVVKALKALVTDSTNIRDTDTLAYNLIVCPGYPELIQNMIELNTDIGQTAFVIGDTPFRLDPTGTELTNYGLNTAGVVDNNDYGAVSYDTNMAMFYPSGYTNDNLGNSIVVPPSHMMIRTIINSDNKSYPWFAPAGTRRGVVDNVTSVGYVVPNTGVFKTVSLYQGLRDVLATPGVRINPIASLPGIGIVNMGQYTRVPSSYASALDRINVSRLVAYIRRQLNILAKPFLFEPNDSQTRTEVKAAVDALLAELVSQRALYDFLTVCDSSNNTPARIDRSELWVDIAIEPVKAVEFIYIPVRILNTGAIKALNK